MRTALGNAAVALHEAGDLVDAVQEYRALLDEAEEDYINLLNNMGAAVSPSK
jgi:hypothetical protein